ncbi:hypothetical protein MKX01_002294, partial [Papaver californicum]
VNRRLSNPLIPGEVIDEGIVVLMMGLGLLNLINDSEEEENGVDSYGFRCSSSSNNQRHLPWTICNPQFEEVEEVNDNTRNLTEKLYAALLNIRVKEDLVKQHARVSEEAVSG